MDSKRCKRVLAYFSMLVVLVDLNLGESRAPMHVEGLDRQNHTMHQIKPSTYEPGKDSLERVVTSKRKDISDTERIDPFDKFNKYKGGFNITDKHYWSSIVYTGIYGFAIGVLVLLTGVLYGGFLFATTLCCGQQNDRNLKKRVPYSRHCYLWLIIVGVSLTILVIITSGVVIVGVSKFHSRAITMMNIIVETANGTSNTINNVTLAMRNIRDKLVMSNGGSKESTFLDSKSQKLDMEAEGIRRQAKKTRNFINKVLKILYITTIITISLNLIVVILSCVCGLLKIHRAFYLFIVLCWLLATLCWMYFGLYFSLGSFTSDTCNALEEFQQNPYNNSLSSIIPCNELHSAKSLLINTKVGIYNLINEVNANISSRQMLSFPILVQVCNPLSAPPQSHYQPQDCPANTIAIKDIPKVLRVFKCSNTIGSTCNRGEFISNEDFKIVEEYTSSIQSLLDALPSMESLVDCRLVKTAFGKIMTQHCEPVKKNVKIVWVSLVVLSTITMILILVWAIKASEQNPHFSNSSVRPQFIVA